MLTPPYNLGNNAYASNPSWYIGGDNKNGESELAGTEFFDTDKDFRPAEFMHFCSQMLRPEPKGTGKAPCMIIFCGWEQQFYYKELGERYGFKGCITLVFRKNYSAQVLKANMKVVGNCEYGLILYRDKLPKFNNNGEMIMNCMEFPRELGMPRTHPTQKPLPLLKKLIMLFTDTDMLEMQFRQLFLKNNVTEPYIMAKVATADMLLELAVKIFEGLMNEAKKKTRYDFTPWFRRGKIDSPLFYFRKAADSLLGETNRINPSTDANLMRAIRILEKTLTDTKLFNRAGYMALQYNTNLVGSCISQEDYDMLAREYGEE